MTVRQVSIAIGILAALNVFATTDEIIQSVNDASNSAMRVNVVTGIATPVPTLAPPTPLAFSTPGKIAIFGSPELQPYAGYTCPTPQIGVGQDAAGTWTCVTPVPTATPLPTATPGTASSATIFTSGTTNTLSGGSTTDYTAISGFVAVSQTDGTNALRLPAGTFSQIGCALNSALSQGSYTMAVRKNGVDQAVTCAISTQTCSDIAHTFATSTNDNISISIVPAGTPTTGVSLKCWSKFAPS